MSPARHGCEAVQVSDQMRCERCDLVWDMNDYDPPKCLSKNEVERRHRLEKLNEIRETLQCSKNS